MKLIILVISSKKGFYPKLEEAIRDTWASKNYPNVNIFFQHCINNHHITNLDPNQNLNCRCDPGLSSIGYKMVESLEYLVNNINFDYIFRTNLSSYVDVEKLYNFILNNHMDYGGFTGDHDNIKFASGAGYILSKSCVDLILTHKHKWDHSIIDDVALASLLKQLNISPTHIPRQTLTRAPSLTSDDLIDLNQFHYRCKRPDRNEDIFLFNKIHELKTLNTL